MTGLENFREKIAALRDFRGSDDQRIPEKMSCRCTHKFGSESYSVRLASALILSQIVTSGQQTRL